MRYLLEGSVRKVGSALRVNAQLVSTETGDHLWADHVDIEPGTVGTSHDDIVQRIVTVMTPQLLDVERTRGQLERPGNPNALDLYLQARALRRIPDPKRLQEIVDLCERALVLDPSLIRAMTLDAIVSLDMLQGRGDPMWAELTERAERRISQAEAMAAESLPVLEAKGFMLRIEKRYTEAIAVLEHAVELYPNQSELESNLGQSLIQLGRPAEAIPHVERAIRLNPRSRTTYLNYRRMSEATGLLGRYEECAAWSLRTSDANPSASPGYRAARSAWLAAAQQLLGRHDAARAAVEQAARLSPGITVRSFAMSYNTPELASQMLPVITALRLAGLRDHADENAQSDLPADGKLYSDGYA